MKKKMLIILFCAISINLKAQIDDTISFYANLKYMSQDKIKLEVKNNTKKNIYYYIGVVGVVNSGYVPIVTDLKSIKQKKSLSLSELKPGCKFIKIISRKEIIEANLYKGDKIKFYLDCFQDINFKYHLKTIWSQIF